MPDAVLQRLGAFIDSLRPAADLTWSSVVDLHITTKFLGNQSPARIAAIERALACVTQPPFCIDVRGVGWFPTRGSPHVFWAGVAQSQELSALLRETERKLAPLGIPVEDRPYSPHVTLARVPVRADLTALREALAQSGSPELGSFTVRNFTLYESRRVDGGGKYRALATFPLSR